ncbi:hypothetical protein QQ045_019905 [Rhodiola kirilowii]
MSNINRSKNKGSKRERELHLHHFELLKNLSHTSASLISPPRRRIGDKKNFAGKFSHSIPANVDGFTFRTRSDFFRRNAFVLLVRVWWWRWRARRSLEEIGYINMISRKIDERNEKIVRGLLKLPVCHLIGDA